VSRACIPRIAAQPVIDMMAAMVSRAMFLIERPSYVVVMIRDDAEAGTVTLAEQRH